MRQRLWSVPSGFAVVFIALGLGLTGWVSHVAGAVLLAIGLIILIAEISWPRRRPTPVAEPDEGVRFSFTADAHVSWPEPVAPIPGWVVVAKPHRRFGRLRSVEIHVSHPEGTRVLTRSIQVFTPEGTVVSVPGTWRARFPFDFSPTSPLSVGTYRVRIRSAMPEDADRTRVETHFTVATSGHFDTPDPE